MRISSIKKQDILACGLLAFLGFFLIYHFAEGTTPLISNYDAYDSGIFQTVGKLWSQGLIPYSEVFDHKGPLLFFIQRVAFSFENSTNALYCIESLFVCVSLWLFYAIFRLSKGVWISLASCLLCIAFWIPIIEYGNLSEEYSMPFVLWALYIQIKYLFQEKRMHKALWGFIYGICLGAVALIRINNALIIFVGIGVIGLQLLCAKQYRVIMHNLWAFLLGISMAFLPFVLYFAYHHALNDMLYATFAFNVQYIQMTAVPFSLKELRNVLWFLWPAVVCIVFSVVHCIEKRIFPALFLGLGGIATLYFTLNGHRYAHYFMLMLPLIALAFSFYPKTNHRVYKYLIMGIVAIVVAITVKTTLEVAPKQYIVYNQAVNEANNKHRLQWQSVIDLIPKEERNQVATMGLSSLDTLLFTHTDLVPSGRYIILMEWHAKVAPHILKSYINFLKSEKAKWIIVKEKGLNNKELIDTLHKHYQCVRIVDVKNESVELYNVK